MRRLSPFLPLIGCGLILTGCLWPPYGEGGMDEAFDYSRTARTEATPLAFRLHSWPTRLTLAKRLDSATADINRLKETGADQYTPAALEIIERRWTLAARECAGGLFSDCALRLTEIETAIADLQKLLEAIKPRSMLSQL